jgi:putative transposase
MKALRPVEKRELVRHAKHVSGTSGHKACGLFRLSETVYYYKAIPKDQDSGIEDELRSMVEVHANWGFWQIFYNLRMNHYTWNHKRVYRVYKNMKLNTRREIQAKTSDAR